MNLKDKSPEYFWL